jgi:hypothetical protein
MEEPMIGLIVLAVAVAYLLLWLVVVTVTYRIAKRKGASRKKAWVAAGIACLLMYLIPFWDWLPTVAAHRYYCWKDSGFTVYKTLDQWKAENPGVAETLRWKDLSDHSVDPRTGNQTVFLNQRFLWETHYRHLPILPVTIYEDRLVDRETNAILARAVDLGTGCGNPMTSNEFCSWKGWLDQGRCDITGRATREFMEMETAARKLGGHQ